MANPQPPHLSNSLYAAFMRNVVVTSGNCWLWTGALHDRDYGSFRIDGVQYRAHRLAVTLFLDPDYDPRGRGIAGDIVLHACDTPLCVSPLCIGVGSQSRNNKESWDRADPNRRLEFILRMRKANTGRSPSAETRAKLSLSKLGNKNGLGNKSRIGQHHSIETRKKMRRTWALKAL
jgi:hypothetical protein